MSENQVTTEGNTVGEAVRKAAELLGIPAGCRTCRKFAAAAGSLPEIFGSLPKHFLLSEGILRSSI